MSNKNFSMKDVYGWLVMIAVFGLLYLTGLHTEVIGQVQRLLLATSLFRPELPEENPEVPTDNTTMVGQDFLLQSLDGQESFRLESLQGKVVFINFWATWCPPCIAEMPNIQSLYEQVRSDKITFLMVSLDEDPAKALRFIEKKGYTLPVFRPASPLPKEFITQSIPTTIVLSPEGKLIVHKEGMADYDTQEFRSFLLHLSE
ncbi:thiol-disulfide isomerase/thioredoxin [Pontibacter ummariensis]|uniref:Thiol-disulfide isomerase or thioredoxin n=1 Tax=Pontibacter ummariensis TaxID=1610492 RepID=A0A239I6X2_9BACT|nr:TlpA disulfide reductase family protein [Pontibacter ummariensis]PRY10015.1 thiol-disulfide isomerase/thioredoxin [Pontibacter ummariensis]SNS89269.1 Thiol-disulfide isomerase or thioredoxin [Pontibacter ummariensis]